MEGIRKAGEKKADAGNLGEKSTTTLVETNIATRTQGVRVLRHDVLKAPENRGYDPYDHSG